MVIVAVQGCAQAYSLLDQEPPPTVKGNGGMCVTACWSQLAIGRKYAAATLVNSETSISEVKQDGVFA
jgi:hypothetical protein